MKELREEKLKAQLARHTLRTDGCWLWRGSVNNDGYAVVWPTKTGYGAHRARWETERGNIPAGICVLHKCDNRSCTNPQHLFLGTRDDNNKDRATKKRSAVGERAGRAKLTERQVFEIKRLYATGSFTLKSLGMQHGITLDQVHRILKGKSWRHLSEQQA